MISEAIAQLQEYQPSVMVSCPSCSGGTIEREDRRFVSSASLVQDFVIETCNRCQGSGVLDACAGCLAPADRDCECEDEP